MVIQKYLILWEKVKWSNDKLNNNYFIRIGFGSYTYAVMPLVLSYGDHLDEFDVCSLFPTVVLVIWKYLILWEKVKWSNDKLNNNNYFIRIGFGSYIYAVMPLVLSYGDHLDEFDVCSLFPIIF